MNKKLPENKANRGLRWGGATGGRSRRIPWKRRWTGRARGEGAWARCRRTSRKPSPCRWRWRGSSIAPARRWARIWVTTSTVRNWNWCRWRPESKSSRLGSSISAIAPPWERTVAAYDAAILSLLLSLAIPKRICASHCPCVASCWMRDVRLIYKYEEKWDFKASEGEMCVSLFASLVSSIFILLPFASF